jgi:hypothetical protein
MNDYEHTEVLKGTVLHKLAVAHWDYVRAVIINSESNINHKLLDIIGFHYVTAFKHGYKHAKGEIK